MAPAAALLTLALLVSLGAHPTSAQCTLSGSLATWSDGNSNWNNGANWSTGTVPNSTGMNVCITDGTSTVTLDINASVASLQLAQGNTLTLGDGTELSLNGPIINAGTINVDAVTSQTVLYLNEDATLSGGGTVVLSSTGANAAVLNGNSSTLTNLDNIIEGSGEIGENRNLSIINQTNGTIDANAAGQTLLLYTGAFTNTGTLEATEGGTLAIQSVINNQNGTILASGSGSSVLLNANQAEIQGGTLNTTNGGTMGISGGTYGYLDGSTHGALTNLGTFTVNNDSTLYISGAIINQGTISVTSVNNGATLDADSNVTLSGGGTVMLSTTGANTATLSGNSSTLTNVDNLIEGAGEIGGNRNVGIINQTNGTIDANTAGQTLLLYTSTFTNTGTLEATEGGTLAIQSVINNQNGTILASGGSSVLLNGNGATIQGGTLNTTGGGTMGSSGGVTVTLDGSTNGALTNLGTFTVADNSGVNIVGSIVNRGTIDVVDTGDGASLQLSGNTTLSGGGTITLQSSAANTANLQSYPSVGSTPTLTNVDNLIQGAGNIGGNFGLTVINQATIDANVTSGTLSLTTSSFTNTGTLEATNGGTLSIQSSIANNGGLISSSAGSSVFIENGATIYGGTLNSNGGTLEAGNITLDGGTSNGALTIIGTFSIGDTADVGLNTGTIINQGTIAVNALTGSTDFFVGSGDTVTLTGGGTVALTSTGSATAFLEGAGGTLINTNNTIEGTGYIGTSNGHLTFINQGTVDANVTSGVLYFSTCGNCAAQTANSGTLEATNGGTLAIQTVVDNQNGTIFASGAGSSVLLNENGTTIQGGTLDTTLGGTIGSAGGVNVTLNGGTANGAVTNVGTFVVANTSTVNIIGSIVNEGTMNVNALTNSTELEVPSGDTATLTGGGTVALTSTGSATAFLEGAGGTLINADNTIEGTGYIGTSNGHLTFINQSNGIVDANVKSGVLNVSTCGNCAVQTANSGTLEATNGGILAIQTTIDNQNGTIVSNGAGSNVTLDVNQVVIQGGTLNTVNGGTMGSAGGVYVTLDGSTHGALTNLGTFTVADSSTVYVTGAIINAGTINISSTGDGTNLLLANDTTLSGGGTVMLSGASGGATIGTYSGSSLTNLDNTIEGVGNISTAGLVNQGTINANVAGQALSVTTGTLTNTGLIQATGTGTLSIPNLTNITNTGGTIEARDSGSTVQFGNSPTITGGVVDGMGAISGNFTLSGGTIAPGLSALNAPGTLTVNGNLTQSGGAFDEIISSASSYGILTVNGSAVLSSGSATTLDITLASGFTPTTGEKFTILDATSLIGTFSNGSAFVEDGYNWTLTYGTSGGTSDAVLTLGTAVGPTAVTATWTNAGNQNWTTGTWNCVPTCVPNNSASNVYNAVLNSPGYTMTLSSTDSPSSITINSLNIQAGELDVNAGASLTVTGTTTVGSSVSDVIRADGSTVNVGTLTNLAGGVLTGGGYQAANGGVLNINGNVTTISGATAVILDGSGSELANGAGDALAGLTNIVGGGLTLFDGASETIAPGGGTFSNDGGAVNASFGGSSLTVNGGFSNTNGGLVNVNGTGGGASVNVAGNFTNDSTSGTTMITVENGGALNITGAGNSFTNQNNAQMSVNTLGTVSIAGNFTNESGAQVALQTGGALGVSGNFVNESSGSVQVNGASLSVNGNLTNQGLAGMVVQNGGSLSVTGATGVINSSNMSIGSASGETANSSLTVTNAFVNSGTLQLAATVGTTTTQATVGSFNNFGNVSILAGTTLTSTGAYTQTTGGVTTVQGALQGTGGVNINGGTLQGAEGIVPGSGTINGLVTIGAGGTLMAGTSLASPGTLNFGGALNINNGTLAEVINSNTAGSFGVLDVTGTLTLGVGSKLDILSTYDPAAGTTLTIATTGSSTAGLTFGTIENDTFTGPSGKEMWVVVDSGHNIELEAELVGVTDVSAIWSTASGNWNTATQWSCSPGPGTCVPNDSPSNVYEVTLNSPGQTLTLDNSGGTITVRTLALTAGTLNIQSGATLNLVNQPGGITDVASGAGLTVGGTFDVINGGTSTSALAGLTSVEGTLTLQGQNITATPSGAPATFTNTGTVNLQQGTAFTVEGALTNSGTINTGNGASDVGSNSLTVTGTLTSNGTLSLNAAGDSEAAAVLSNGGGITLNAANQTLSVAGAFGNSSGGSLTFNPTASSSTVSVGGAFTNDGMVNMNGSGDTLSAGSFSNSGAMSVGANESLKSTGDFGGNSGGSLTVAGGAVTVGGNFNNALGSSLVMEGGALATASSVSIAGTFTNGGTVDMEGTGDPLTVSGAFANSGSVTVGNSETLNANAGYTNTGTTDVTGTLNTTTYQHTSGTTTIETGGTLAATSFNQAGGSVQGTGTIVGAYTLSAGTITPGSLASSTPGTLTINGSFTQTGGAFDELMNGASNGVLDVNGTVSLSNASLDILGNYDPAAGTKLTLVETTSSTAGLTFGTIENDTFTGPSGPEKWVVIDSGDDIDLEAETVPPTDVTAKWTTGSGNWNTATQWSCSPGTTCVPNNSPSNVYEVTLNSPGQTLTLDNSGGTITVNTLALTAGTLNIQTGATLNLVNQPGITDVNANSGLIVGGTFEVTNGASVTSAVAGLTSVEGTLTLANGQTTNLTPTGGTLTISASGIVNVQQGTALTLGTPDQLLNVNNSGTINLGNGASDPGGNSLVVSATLTNNGSVTLSAANDSASAGVLTNSGTISLNGNHDSFAGYTISNYGTISISGTNDTFPNDLGPNPVTNNSGGQLIFQSSSNGSTFYSGLFYNYGTISMNGHGDALDPDALFNAGTISVGAGETLSSGETITNEIGGSLTVSGGSVSTQQHELIENDGTLTLNGNGGTLSAGPLQNFGTILALGSASGSNSIQTTEDFINNSGASLTVAGTAITVGGNFDNAAGATMLFSTSAIAGTGPAGSVAVAGTFTNGGTLEEEGANDTLTVTGAFTNSGSLGVTATNTLTANGGYTNTGAETLVFGGTLNTTTYQNGAGTTTVEGGGIISTTNFNQTGGSVQGTGAITGAYTLSAGTMTPGFADAGTPGTLTINGSFTQTGGIFNEFMNGISNGIINVSGAVSLSNATLDILSTYDPAAGTILTIVTTGASTAGLTFGTIENDTFTGPSGNEMWVVVDSGHNIELEAETVAATDVTATWSTASGNWNMATQWSCSPGTTCVPNNSPSNVYEVVLNSPAQSGVTQTLTLDNSGGTITVNTLALTAGTLDIQSGATLNLVNQPGGITDINANSGLILGGTFEVNGTTSALAGLTSVEGTLTLANGQTTTVTPSGGTFTVNSVFGVNVDQGSTFAVNGDLNIATGGIATGFNPVTGTTTGGGSNNSILVSGSVTANGFIYLYGNQDTMSAAAITTGSLGNITLNGTKQTLTVAGTFANNGSLGLLGANDSVSAGTFTNTGGIELAAANTSLTVAGNFTNSAGPVQSLFFDVLSNGSTLSVGGVFTNNSGASVTMEGTGDTLSAASFANSGTITVGAQESLISTGDFDNNTGGSLVLSNLRTALSIGGNFNNAVGATVQYTDPPGPGGNVTTVAGAFTNGGTVNMQGAGDTLTVSGAFTNSGSVLVGATEMLNANGGYINTGTTSVAGILNTTTYQQNAGSTDVSGTLNATTYQYNGGTTTIETGGQISTASFTQTGGSIQGTGSIGATGGTYMLTGGTITPGSSIVPAIGSLAVNGSYTQSGGTFDELIGPTGNGLLSVNGPVVLEDSARLDITLLSDATLTDGEVFDILNYMGSESGAFIDAPSGEFAMDGWNWDINYGYDGDEVLLTAESPETVATPEPSALLLLATGLPALGVFYRRKRAARAR